MNGFFFPPSGGRGAFLILSKGDDYLMGRDQNYKDVLFVAEDFVDLLFKERLFLFIPPFQLICWLLTAILKTGSSGYVFLLKSLSERTLCHCVLHITRRF